MSNFDLNAILRGAQLTLVGANRALQNPGLFTSEHYRQAALAVAAGIVIRLIVAIPILVVRLILYFLVLFNTSKVDWDHDILEGLHFFENSVLQIPFFLMSLMRYVTPTLDQMFMDSLSWVDQTYAQKHQFDGPHALRPMYYPNLKLYSTHHPRRGPKRTPREAIVAYGVRSSHKAAISLAVYLLSFLPYVGRFVLPAASFYTFNQAVGPRPAMIIFGSSVFLPRRYLVVFLQSYFSSRSLMRELLEPYFQRVHFTKEQKRKWFKDREGVLFGFGIGFFLLFKIPLLGVLIYGISEASTAYLITKITDPPPAPSESSNFAESQTQWKNKQKFLSLSLSNLDAHNLYIYKEGQSHLDTNLPGKMFT